MLAKNLLLVATFALVASPLTASPSFLINSCSKSLTIGEIIMGVPVATTSAAPAGQQHGFEVTKAGAAVACGDTLNQGDVLTVKVDQDLASAIAAEGWTEFAGPAYVLEATNDGILESGSSQRGCSNSRIINAAGDISLQVQKGGDLTIRMISGHAYGPSFAADECTFSVIGSVSHSGFLGLAGGSTAAPWEQTVESLLSSQATGYTVLEEAADGTFSVKYTLDDAGNTIVRELLESISSQSGPAITNVQFTVEGFTGNDNIIDVSTVERCVKGSCDGFSTAGEPEKPPSEGVELPGSGLYVLSSRVDGETITTTITSDDDAWFAVGVSTPEGGMTGGGDGADMFVCSSEGLRRFWVTGKSNPENFPTVDVAVDAAGAAEEKNLCVFEDGAGRMTFTRTLAAGENEREIVPGVVQNLIWARGASGEQALASGHASRGLVNLDLTDVAGGVTEVKIKGQWTLWLHLLLMAPAWGMILPLGAAVANRARNVEGAPEGAWFKLHKTMQRIGWGLQLFGFIFAVVHCDQYSAHWQHPHTIIGLIVVIIGTLQPVNALLRPHPPQGGWPEGKKPFGRVVFELWHKGVGWVTVILGMVNVIIGCLLAKKLDFNTATWAVPLAIGCTGISAFLLYLVLGLVAPSNGLNRALTGAKPGRKETEMGQA